MALAETTLSSAQGANDKTAVVASAASISVGRLLLIDGETEQVTKDYDGSSTTVPVLRGQNGSAQVAHPSGVRVTHGNAADFGNPGAGTAINFPPAGRARLLESVSATGTLTLAPSGTDHVVVLNGSGAITLTIPVPTKDKDGDLLIIVNNTGAAHVPTFTGGLGGAGSSYDAVTFNATGKLALLCVACDETWNSICAPGMGGTVTNIIGSVA